MAYRTCHIRGGIFLVLECVHHLCTKLLANPSRFRIYRSCLYTYLVTQTSHVLNKHRQQNGFSMFFPSILTFALSSHKARLALTSTAAFLHRSTMLALSTALCTLKTRNISNNIATLCYCATNVTSSSNRNPMNRDSP